MKPVITSGKVDTIPISEIRPSHDNPRGRVSLDSSFQRLADSIADSGILVPLVVRELASTDDGIKYELVDGERRFRAAQAVRRPTAPVHIVRSDVDDQDLRRFMFQLHMTREQWEPLAQVKSLSEMYPETDAGIAIAEKPRWVRNINTEASMDVRTASDRVHLLCWPKELRERIYKFDEEHRDDETNIYSYILAIEASIIEPAYRALKDGSGAHGIDEKLNRFRKTLLDKLIIGLTNGRIHNRDQIRDLKPLFDMRVKPPERREAKKIFDDLVTKQSYGFDDAKTDLELKLPQLLAEKPATPRRVIAMMKSLSDILREYKIEFIEAASKNERTRKKLRAEFAQALRDLLAVGKSLQGNL